MYTYTVYTINMYFNTFFGKVWFETEFGCFLFESNGSTYELNQATFESQQNPKKIVWKITYVFSEKRTLFLPFCNLKAYIIPAGSPQKISSLLQWPEFTRKLWMSTKRALWWNGFFFLRMHEWIKWMRWLNCISKSLLKCQWRSRNENQREPVAFDFMIRSGLKALLPVLYES